ncbi:hypothetical protein MKW94_024594 [Papaver nudicaule]|uniref:ethanolamine-phosphate cytidylyltransferase n=1 Tax=Papaver nudicaule TaxID=74823 RepID=A0AA41VFA0_PAPNU|nr:hypothetical protein [Papaver nudicaule]
MGSMEYDSHNWIWDGVYYYPHFFGGIMLTAAVLGLSTSYFSGMGVHYLPFYWPDLRLFHKKRHVKKPVRVYMDGFFDLMHYGHANALRQAKALGDVLVVGVVSDEEIIANKGPPVLSMEERLVLVKGFKWVDEVIANAPYEITEQFMGRLFNEHQIDFVIHGDDPCLLPDGTDAYHIGNNLPIMHLHERSLSVLACRYVDEVIIGTPWEVTKDMVQTCLVLDSNSLLYFVCLSLYNFSAFDTLDLLMGIIPESDKSFVFHVIVAK